MSRALAGPPGLRCPACGRIFQPPAEFCPHCRANLRQASQPKRPRRSLARRLGQWVGALVFLTVAALLGLKAIGKDHLVLDYLEGKGVPTKALRFWSRVSNRLPESWSVPESWRFWDRPSQAPGTGQAPSWPPPRRGPVLIEDNRPLPDLPLAMYNLPWAGYRTFDELWEAYQRSEERQKAALEERARN